MIRATVPRTGFISLSVSLAHLSEVRMSFSVQSYNLVDVVNDHLS